MGIALIIKNVNFEQNKVANVVFNDVPCTGLSLASDSFTLTREDVGTSLGIAITPSNCTDAVIVTVADNSIAKVENGSIFASAIGQTTVTVVCGNYKATATITVPYIDVYLTRFENRRAQIASWGQVTMQSNENYDGYAIPYVYDGQARGIYNGSADMFAMVALTAKNSTRFEIHQPDNKGGYGNIRFANALTNPYNATTARGISSDSYTDRNSDGVSDTIFTIPDGVDSLAIEKTHAASDANMFLRFLPAE